MENNNKFIVYVINDDALEDAYNWDNVDEFEELVEDNAYLNYNKVEFESEDLVMAYLEGVFRGCDERAPCGKIALKSWIEEDKPYIDIILNR